MNIVIHATVALSALIYYLSESLSMLMMKVPVFPILPKVVGYSTAPEDIREMGFGAGLGFLT